jgi:hypothetical protein
MYSEITSCIAVRVKVTFMRRSVLYVASTRHLSKQCDDAQPSAVTSIYTVPLAFSCAITFLSAFNYLLSCPSNSPTHLTVCHHEDNHSSRRRTYYPPVQLKLGQCLRTKGWWQQDNGENYTITVSIFIISSNTITILKSIIVSWARVATRATDTRSTHKMLVAKHDGKKSFGSKSCKWGHNIKTNLQKNGTWFRKMY